MPALHIRDIPEDVIEALKQRAAQNDRSLQKELRHILLTLVRQNPTIEGLPPLRLHLSNASPNTDWSRDQIYEDDGR